MKSFTFLAPIIALAASVVVATPIEVERSGLTFTKVPDVKPKELAPKSKRSDLNPLLNEEEKRQATYTMILWFCTATSCGGSCTGEYITQVKLNQCYATPDAALSVYYESTLTFSYDEAWVSTGNACQSAVELPDVNVCYNIGSTPLKTWYTPGP